MVCGAKPRGGQLVILSFVAEFLNGDRRTRFWVFSQIQGRERKMGARQFSSDRFHLWRRFPLSQGCGEQGRKKLFALIPAFSRPMAHLEHFGLCLCTGGALRDTLEKRRRKPALAGLASTR